MNQRRILGILLLLGAMLGLQQLPSVDPTSTTLVGFVLLTAYALSRQ